MQVNKAMANMGSKKSCKPVRQIAMAKAPSNNVLGWNTQVIILW